MIATTEPHTRTPTGPECAVGRIHSGPHRRDLTTSATGLRRGDCRARSRTLPWDRLTGELHAVDIGFAVCAVSAIVVRGNRRGLAIAAGAFVFATLVALAVNPSILGLLTVWRWLGVTAVVAAAVRVPLVACVGTWAVSEALLAFAQKLIGGPVGLPSPFEPAEPFARFGGEMAPMGTFWHPYLLAGLALLGGVLLADAARDRPALLVPAAIAVAPVGFTYSRMALVGLAIALACLAVARLPAAVIALAVGAALPATVWHDGWIDRARDSANARSINELGRARSEMSRQSVQVIRNEPLAGAGLGRYVEALREGRIDVSGTGGAYYPVHNLPLLAAAEGGVVAGLAMLVLLGFAGVAAARAGPAALAIFGAFLPFCLLDHYPYTSPQGIALTALWLGAIAATRRRATATRRVPPSANGSRGRRTPAPSRQPDLSPSG